ncbi:MAG: hypothetical protein ACI32C_00250 [Candidatus Enteromonas sp.]
MRVIERTGRGVPTIRKRYGEEAFSFSGTWLHASIQFSFAHAVDYRIAAINIKKSDETVVRQALAQNQLSILKSIRNNPNIIVEGLSRETGLGHAAIYNNLKKLKAMGILARVGSRKQGYWDSAE